MSGQRDAFMPNRPCGVFRRLFHSWERANDDFHRLNAFKLLAAQWPDVAQMALEAHRADMVCWHCECSKEVL